MTKYLNPVNYLKFIKRKIDQYNVKKLEKKINNIKFFFCQKTCKIFQLWKNY